MSTIRIKTTDDHEVVINRELLILFSELAKTSLSADAHAAELSFNITSTHFKWVQEYIEYHAKKETASPVPPLTASWTIDNSFEDKWDSIFLKRIVAAEQDPLLIDFCRAVEYLDLTTLLKKVTLVVAINAVQTYGLKSDKLAEEFSKIALKK